MLPQASRLLKEPTNGAQPRDGTIVEDVQDVDHRWLVDETLHIKEVRNEVVGQSASCT